MKIQLNFDIPVGKEHGLTEGRIIEVTSVDKGDGSRGSSFVKVMGDAGVEVKLLPHEFVVVKD